MARRSKQSDGDLLDSSFGKSKKINRASLKTPQALFDTLRETVIHQDSALQQLACLAFYHKKISEQKTGNAIKQMPVFLTGQTGTGKTHMIQAICQALNLPYISHNVMNLTANSYRGTNLWNLGEKLLKSAKDNKKVAASAIVFFDEFDKLFADRQNTHLQSYHNLLITELMTVIEGTSGFPVDDKGDFVDSSKMLFILGGSFGMHKTDSTKSIGFHQTTTTNKKSVSDQLSLTELGLPDELAGRIGTIVKMQKLTTSQLTDVFFNSPSSPIKTLESKLALSDCKLKIERDFIEALIDDSTDFVEKFGVRGVYQAFQRLPAIGEMLFQAPNQPGTTYRLTSEGYGIVGEQLSITEQPPPTKQPPKLNVTATNNPLSPKYKAAVVDKQSAISEVRQRWLDSVARLNQIAFGIIQDLKKSEQKSLEELKLLAKRYESWERFYKEYTVTHGYVAYATKAELLMIDASLKKQWAQQWRGIPDDDDLPF